MFLRIGSGKAVHKCAISQRWSKLVHKYATSEDQKERGFISISFIISIFPFKHKEFKTFFTIATQFAYIRLRLTFYSKTSSQQQQTEQMILSIKICLDNSF